MRIDAADVRAACADPVAVARALGLVVAHGSRRVRVCCPWHNEKNPSCAISVRDGRVVAYCHACHAGGDLIALVAAVEGLDARTQFQAVLERAAQLFGVSPRRGSAPVSPPRRVDPEVALAARVEQAADDWLAGRSVRVDVVIERCPDPMLAGAFADLRALDAERRGRRKALGYLAVAAQGAHARVR